MDSRHPASSEHQDEACKDLPQCKIKRNYSCIHCSYFTQNPRFYLSHLRDTHGERITISNCSLCLYASRHYQKLVRHMKMVHGSSAEDIPGQSRKRPLIEEVVSSDHPALPPLPIPSKWIIDIDNLSYDLKSSRKTLKDFAAIYFAENDCDEIFKKMEESDVVEVVPFPKGEAPTSIGVSLQNIFGDPKCLEVVNGEKKTKCACGYVPRSFLDLVDHEKSCFESKEKDCEDTPLDLSVKWSNEDVRSSTPKKEYDSKPVAEDLKKIKLGSKIEEEQWNTELQDKSLNVDILSKEATKPNGSIFKKVFKCPLCPFWALTASRFHVHMVGHQNKKQFKCSMCDYCSNWRWDITKHIRLRAFRSTTHKNARIVMQGENDHRNYSKYDRYITLMETSEQDELRKCGEMTSRDLDSQVMLPWKENENDIIEETKLTVPSPKKVQVPFSSVVLPPNSNCFSKTTSKQQHHPRSYVIFEDTDEPLYKCTQCQFSHPNRDAVLVHVKIHHQDLLIGSEVPTKLTITPAASYEDSKVMPIEKQTAQPIIVDIENKNVDKKDLKPSHDSLVPNPSMSNEHRSDQNINDRTSNSNNEIFAPFRCWHCHQVSNWKHVIQRHCRLKHSGSIRIEAIDRSIDPSNPTYRLLNLLSSSSILLSDENQTDQKVDKVSNQKSDKEIYTTMSDLSLKDSNKSQKTVKSSEKDFMKLECKDSKYQLNKHLVQKHKPSSSSSSNSGPENFPKSSSETESKNYEISDKLEKCQYCSFASSCHSAMRCHEQSHYRILKQNNTLIDDNTIDPDFKQTEILTGKTDQSVVDTNLPLDKSSEVNHEMDTNHKEIKLKIKHSKVAVTTTVKSKTTKTPSVNVNNNKKTCSLKTILVNPKTGQVVRRN
ncbi:uncharacterized protein LOC129949035 [Eupeodes corollae]|uniref:uncharacterized protein LOC129949035 n=1 Tax=Eupeodes corollae TaxID=290404 RepID=UPI0024911F84|nr:uncharacterized protein LOC129949035 [Eupeodes corollae]